MRILVLLFLIITLILFCILFRFYFYKKLQDIIRIKFNKFNFVYGMKFLSVQNFSAENDNENMKVQTAYVSFKNVFGFKRFTTIFFADNIELNILNISKKDKNVQILNIPHLLINYAPGVNLIFISIYLTVGHRS